MSWLHRAACRGADQDLLALFFPDGDGDADPRVKKICSGCPVTTQCEAESADKPSGVWAGLSHGERARQRQQRTRTRGGAR